MLLRPKIGLAVFVRHPDRPGEVILGRRKGSLGAGTYAPPGGHIEHGESFEDCARRETLEETGLTLRNFQIQTVVNAVWPEQDYHYLDVLTSAEIDTAVQDQPINAEPHKCQGWEWFNWSALPPKDQLFRPLQIITSDTQYSPFDPVYSHPTFTQSELPSPYSGTLPEKDGVNRPGARVAVMVKHPGKPHHVLLIRRPAKVSNGAEAKSGWLYAAPEGGIEYGETFEEAARRTALETTGLNLKEVTIDSMVNVICSKSKQHYVCTVASAELDHQTGEMETWKNISWFDTDSGMPDKAELVTSVRSFQELGYSPFDASKCRIKYTECAHLVLNRHEKMRK